MQPMPTLQTGRLLLRGFTPDDLPAVRQIFGDETVNRFLPWLPVRTVKDARAFYAQRLAPAARPEGAYRFAVCLREQPVPIGYVTVSAEDSRDLGYGLLPEYWRRGIVTEAAAAVIGLLRQEGAAYVTATHDVENPRSGAVMRRLGMQYCYSYQEQWMPKNIPVTFRLYQLNFQTGVNMIYKKYWEQSIVHFVENDLV